MADGYENLSKDIPKSVEAVERLVGEVKSNVGLVGISVVQIFV